MDGGSRVAEGRLRRRAQHLTGYIAVAVMSVLLLLGGIVGLATSFAF
jgi:hypothetical protein